MNGEKGSGMDLLRSTGIEDPQDSIYGCGACHIHAIAAARVHGGDRFLVIEDHDEPVWQNDSDSDDYLPAVIHVYSLHGDGDTAIARDILGDRLASEAPDEADELFRIGHMESQAVSLEELLDMTQGRESPALIEDGAENPLSEVFEDDVQIAMHLDSVTADIPPSHFPEGVTP